MNKIIATASRTSYDEVPYPSHPFTQSHPDRLAVIATLLGLKPPRVEYCRVLELGCASGGNLIPMAEALPESTFAGIDLSDRQIGEGQRAIAALGLKNIKLERRSITDIGSDFGQFDYILCHGVFSWVPPAVQDHILAVAKRNLALDGVAYVSYNTLPGWHMRGMIRDMMRYHTAPLKDAAERVGQARGLLDFLAKSVAGEKDPYGLFLKSELEMLVQLSDAYLFHEHLEDFNEPLYFYQFAERAKSKGLRYLGEADVSVMVPGHFPAEVAGVLQRLSTDLVHVEQYMDFLRNRMFRQTLLCHDQHEPRYHLQPEGLTAFQVASPVRPTADKPNLHSTEFEQFDSPKGMSISSRDPIVKAALAVLGEVWPESLPFAKVRAQARARLTNSLVQDAATIAEDTRRLGLAFLQFYTNSAMGLVELRVRPVRASNRLGERPVARPLARWQAAQGPYVTNLLHELVPLPDFERHILQRLDGQHDRARLVEALHELVGRGELTVQQEGEPVKEPEPTRKLLREALEQPLATFARSALLVG